MGKAGRPSMFRGTAGGKRVQGVITKAGAKALDRRRKELATLYKEVHGGDPWTGTVSDGNVIDYLARGEEDTRLHLLGKKA